MFSSWYAFFIVTDSLRNETLFLAIRFLPVSPTLKRSLLQFEFIMFFRQEWDFHPSIKSMEKCPC